MSVPVGSNLLILCMNIIISVQCDSSVSLMTLLYLTTIVPYWPTIVLTISRHYFYLLLINENSSNQSHSIVVQSKIFFRRSKTDAAKKSFFNFLIFVQQVSQCPLHSLWSSRSVSVYPLVFIIEVYKLFYRLMGLGRLLGIYFHYLVDISAPTCPGSLKS